MVDKKWGGTTFGNSLMHRSLVGMLRVVDPRFFYYFTYIFILPPCIFTKGFRFAYQFFRYHRQMSPLRSFIMAYKNHCIFAQAVIDKFAMYAGRHFEIELDGYDNFIELSNKPEGFVQLSSHIGNYEIAGYSVIAKKKRFNALVYSDEKITVMNNRNKMFDNTNIHMIPIKKDMSHLFEINEALSNGETISIPADRLWGSSKYVPKKFLGQEAHFPLGPFQIVTIREVDALIVHVMKESHMKYRVYITRLHYDKNASRKEQIEELITGYVNELERIISLYPTQWYNYFDFWAQ